MTRDRPRVAWVASHPIQYQVPVFRALAKMPELDLTVVFLSEHGMEPTLDPQFGRLVRYDVPLLDGYRWKVATRPRKPSLVARFDGIVSAEIDRDLEGFDCVVVAGWNYLGYVPAVLAARLHHVPVVHLCESNDEDSVRPPLKELVKRAFFAFHLRERDHALAAGSRARRYLERIGVRRENVHDYPYTIDTTILDVARAHAGELREQWRAKLGIGEGDVVFVFSGKLMPKKDPVGVVRAFVAASERRTKGDAAMHLVVVGSGALEADARAAAGDRRDVHFLGFVNQSEIGGVYAASDVVVLPSLHGETWGLVVNEAMAMGCGAIVSARVGSSADLVEGRDTGIVVPPGDVEALASAMIVAARSPELRATWRANAPRVVARHTPERAAEGVREAVLAALNA
jgi:glycosyltransferase involved in cell wall biosynthesis